MEPETQMTLRPEIIELLEKARQGCPDAMGRLVECYSSRLYGFFYRLSGDRDVSEELLSELFLRLVRKIKDCDSGSFENWLFTVASNLFRDHLRKQYRSRKLIEEKTRQEENEAQRPPEKAALEVSDRLQWALDRLDKETAELIMLRYYGDMSFKELAELKKVPIGTILSRVHRGLKKLKDLMDM